MPIDIGRCLNEALATYHKNAILLLGAIIFESLSLLSLFILTGPLMGGIYLMCIAALTNPEKGNARDPRQMTAEEYEAWYCTAYPSSIAFQIDEAVPEGRASVVYGVTGATADVLGRLRGILMG